MRLVVTEFVTLDGVFQDPGGVGEFERGGWAFQFDRGDAGNKFKYDELMAAEAQLLGRKTYEGFAAAWPSRTDEGGFADKFNSMPKYVVSSTLTEATWTNSTIVSGDIWGEIAKLRERPGGDLLVAGSGELVRGLLEHALVDELRLMVFPVVLGAGEKLFGESPAALPLEVVGTEPAGETVILTLQPKRS
jgi:dihydrofolate reductase